jgi:hypothetical protein
VAKRNDRVAPPARAGEWTLIFADNAAASGWEDLCKTAPGPTRDAWDHLSKNPRSREPNPNRVSQLKSDLGVREVKGKKLEQWQYEVTGAGRIWYCPDDATKTVFITYAGVGHPKATD